MNTLFCYCKNLTVTLIPLLILFFAGGCKKESPLTPSGLDENHFVNHDIPDDPVDHAIYNFYQSTGIASFYNDTIAIQKISKAGEVPERFLTVKLSLDYYPTSMTADFTYAKLRSKQYIPGVLALLQTDVIRRIPDVKEIQSILYVDSLRYYSSFTGIELSHGFTAAYGFNTVGVEVKDVQIMGEPEKKMYAASILAGLAIKQLRRLDEERLQQDYFSISRGLAKNVLPNDVYNGFPYFGTLPSPSSIALLYIPMSNLYAVNVNSFPSEVSDLRSFLTMAFRYSKEELDVIYKNYTPILQKINIVRELLLKYGYTLPE